MSTSTMESSKTKKLNLSRYSWEDDQIIITKQKVSNIFCPTGQGGGINPTCKASGIGSDLKNSPHTGTTEKVAALQKQHDALQSQRDTLSSQASQIHNEERAARASGNKEEYNRLTKARESLESQGRELGKRQLALNEEAHGIIKTELSIIAGGKGSPSNLQDPSGATSPTFSQDVGKAKQFLEGMVHNANVPPVATGYATANNRPGYEPLGKSITASTMDTPRAVVHEYGHHLEYNVPGVQKAAQEFLKYRTAGEPLTNMKEKFPEGRYKPEETGRKDDFDKAFEERSAYYVGKQYKDGSTEVIAMGIEKIHSDPIKFAKQDPEYFTFMLGVLSGKHRDGNETGYDRAKTFTGNSLGDNFSSDSLGHTLLATNPNSPTLEFFQSLVSTMERINQQGKEKQETTVNVFNTVPLPTPTSNVYCPTGSGGGIDPGCLAGGSHGPSASLIPKNRETPKNSSGGESSSGKQVPVEETAAYQKHLANPVHNANEDLYLKDLFTENGFAAPPQKVSKSDMDKLVSEGWTEAFRGAPPAHQDQLRNGELFVGKGVYGAGVYAAVSVKDDHYGDKGLHIANGYASGVDGHVIRLALHPKAKVAEYESLVDAMDSKADKMRSSNPDAKAERKLLTGDEARYAASQGYDAIFVKGMGYLVILNRGKVAIQNERAAGGRNDNATS